MINNKPQVAPREKWHDDYAIRPGRVEVLTGECDRHVPRVGSFAISRLVDYVRAVDDVLLLDPRYASLAEIDKLAFQPWHDGKTTPSAPPNQSRNRVRFSRLGKSDSEDPGLRFAIKPVSSLESMVHQYGAAKRIQKIGEHAISGSTLLKHRVRTFDPVGLYVSGRNSEGEADFALITAYEPFSNLNDYLKPNRNTTTNNEATARGEVDVVVEHVLERGAIAFASMHAHGFAHGDGFPWNLGDGVDGSTLVYDTEHSVDTCDVSIAVAKNMYLNDLRRFLHQVTYYAQPRGFSEEMIINQFVGLYYRELTRMKSVESLFSVDEINADLRPRNAAAVPYYSST